MKLENENTQPYEPKLDNRFQVRFCESIGIPAYVVSSVTLPRYVDGEWQPIELVLYDPVLPSTSHALFKAISKVGSGAEFSLSIDYLDPVKNCVGTWIITFDDFKLVDFGNGSYNKHQADPVEIYLAIDPIQVTLE